jgi:lipoprotein-releasing system ATP-binding protein
MSSITLEINNLNKSFFQANTEFKIVKNISFNIKNSEFIALIGPSGSGKTTILQLCGLLDNPSSGSIKICNQELANANDKIRTLTRKEKIGFIYQFHHLLPEFSAIENVMLPLLIQNHPKQHCYNIALEALKDVELDDKINFKPSQLSGGQQQRVAIARAIVSKPQLILADEPTGNLDYDLSKKIFLLLKNLCKKHLISCLVVTHNIELANYTDRILHLKNGSLES